ncbi:chromatin assembly factor 1 subunit A isoform X2 [Nannospalax galili]|uniref:chromatin assembly factor 1 subunit A isoform X2 n=1 Tax=Nannospalax galili TaxID=1026970 RepID=UPI00111C4CE5|nr:chromatin assembly factor 1 subunit A isoform X2 [Nannospalax galili]
MSSGPIGEWTAGVAVVPAKYERCGRGGSSSGASGRPRAQRGLTGVRAAAAAMLDEPEAAAPRAAAVDCRDRRAFAGKKLIQARLPFKRLNGPKEKAEDRQPPYTSLEDKVPGLEPSLDNLEHTCHTASNLGLSPKLVNGRGPMDSFLGSRMKAGQGVVIIDLTEDSSDLPDSPATLLAQATINGVSLGPTEQQGPAWVKDSSEELACPPETLPDIACPTEDKPHGLGGPGRPSGCKAGSPQSCPEPTTGPRLCPQTNEDGWSEAGGILFKEKVPVVLLQDVLASKLPHTPSPPSMPLDKSTTSESELLESCPEDDSMASQSSLSSASSSSSPEVPAAAPPQHHQSSPPCTPICKIPKRPVKSSTEKSKTKLQRDREQLREEKEKLREEARRAREEARRKKEEEKELKEKERREKREKEEKEKAEKQRLKEERRKERQEALEAKLEEKRKKEEEKRLREEEKRIKAEKAEITRFFQKPKTPQAPKTLAGSCGKFAPFEIKEHMVLAPRCRATLDQDLCTQLDQLLQQQGGNVSFLSDLKARRPLTSGPTRSRSCDTGIINSSEVDGVPERRKFGRMKLLQFSENHRPAYWGTWNKKTAVIRARDPWAQDKNFLDYEVDSDEEWEEEEPGESLSHSEGDEDDDVGEDEDEDDGFFVPHGYLSEDEGVIEECTDPENQKVRQKLKAEEWDELLAKGKRFRVLQPVQVGCVWAAEAASAGADLRLLQQFSACLLDTTPPDEETVPKASRREKRDQQILAQLLPLLHGNVNGSKVIIREFQEHYRRGLLNPQEPTGPPSPLSSPQSPEAAVPSKARLKRLISENSAYEKRPDFRMCWYVHPQVLRSFGQECLPVPCQWTYVTTTPVLREDSGVPAAGSSQGTPVLKRKPGGSMCITQFMKKRRHDGQAVTEDVDGFQADTEEEDDDDDCMIVDGPDVGDVLEPCGATGVVRMGVGDSSQPTSLLGTS